MAGVGECCGMYVSGRSFLKRACIFSDSNKYDSMVQNYRQRLVLRVRFVDAFWGGGSLLQQARGVVVIA